MNILVLGSGGREHAIAWALAKSPLCEGLFVAPGNGGTAEIATNIKTLNIEDGEAVATFAHQNNVGLVVIGPEAPLVKGVADVLRAANIPVFGPDSEGAQLEGSKTYCKEFLINNNLPTARYQSFTDKEAALAYCNELGAPLVVKSDGLAAGKGVVVADTLEAALDAVEACFAGDFGLAGSTVVVEEKLTGPECSLLAFVSGGKAFCMAPAQDHKRAYDGDKGPNTGGMGAYAPVPHLPQSVVDTAVDTIVKPVLEGMIKEGRPYLGVLYAGLILTADGPKVIEFNARFGDPETQIILPRLTSDFAQNITDILDGKEPAITWTDKGVTLGVVVASNGYPLAYEKGVKLPAKTDGDIITYYAGAKFAENGQDLLSNGGRVYMLVTTADTVKDGQNIIYNELNKQNTEGLFYRTDIGSKANK